MGLAIVVFTSLAGRAPGLSGPTLAQNGHPEH